MITPVAHPDFVDEQSSRRAAALALIESWIAEIENMTDDEFRENEEVLRRIDDERPAGRKLFEAILTPFP